MHVCSELNNVLIERCSVQQVVDTGWYRGNEQGCSKVVDTGMISQGLNSVALDRTVHVFKKSSVYRED